MATDLERREKAKVRARDYWPDRQPRCRIVFPCPYEETFAVHVAHLDDKGMGGDHGRRSTADRMIAVCAPHHVGPRSLHSTHLRVDRLTAKGTNGPIATYVRDDVTRDDWRLLLKERAVGVPELGA